MARRRRAPRARVVASDRNRFAAGWRLLPDALELAPAAQAPDLVVDLVRPADLVALTVEGYDVELVSGQNPVIRPKPGKTGRLVVRLAYQHLAERAIYEGLVAAPVPANNPGENPAIDPPATEVPATPLDGPAARPVPPIPARPARTSRLVFELPAGDSIPFTTPGVLEALGRLELLVHPLAKPRQGRMRIPGEGTVFHLPGGLIATADAAGLVVSRAPRGMEIPDPKTASGLSALARDARRIRSVLATRAGTSIAGLDVKEAAGPGNVTIGSRAFPVPGLIGRAGLIRPDIVVRPRPRATLSRPPQQFETAIEAPYRLVISPSARGGWTHAPEPVAAEGAPHRIELWHTRLGVRVEDDERVSVDERRNTQRVVRALWARDREGPELFENAFGGVAFPNWQSLKWPGRVDKPFRSSLDPGDRHMLVRQSAESWLDAQSKPIPPEPVDVVDLWLSALGAWLDLHGEWNTDPYSENEIRSILLWDHVAPLGRDQFVRVVYPGYLFPFGHRTSLVKLTERKMKDAAPSVAGLYQQKFLLVGEPRRSYSRRNFPFDELGVTPLVTPTLDDDPDPSNPFIPRVSGAPFSWVLHCADKEQRPVRLVTPLIWVPAGFPNLPAVVTLYHTSGIDKVAADGQDIAYAEVAKGGDTVVATVELHFDGVPEKVKSEPLLMDASVELPAIQRLSPIGPVTIEYSDIYLANGFQSAQNVAEVWAELPTPPKLSFGQGSAAGSDKAGGFLQPNLEVAGLSRVKGTIGDVAETAQGKFRPEEFLGNALPKLFGLVSLVDVLETIGVDLDDAPDVVSEALERIESFVADLERAKKAAQDAVDEANLLVARAQSKAAELQQQAQQAVQAAQQLETSVTDAVDDVLTALAGLSGKTEAQIAAALANPLQALRNATTDMEQVAPQLPPLMREQLLGLAKVLRQLADAADLIEDVFRFVNGLATGSVQAKFRFEWVPVLKSWSPLGDVPPEKAVLELKKDSLVLAVEGRAAKDEMRVDVLAEIKDFALNLLPGAELVRFKFDHLSFHAGSSGKPEVDVVLQDIEFLGFLGFVETLRELIPFDGFSDPPFLDVTPEGLSAGFTLALPNVSVGVFNLSNMSLGADVQVPFLGKSVTVGFNFCTRDRPFTLAVAFIGGGGWFLMRLSPDGLDVLELGLEAGAILAVDFGVASGSISAMLGIYIRLEGDEGSLSGYFRLRGEVDVLGLISASIELYLVLTYEFDTGKMVGSAKLTIKVEVFCFSTSVTISAERRFAGSVGDPSFVDVMVLPDGTAPAWSKYCVAFAGA
jgi:hypothetical protein